MLSDATKRIATNASIDDKQRFRVLMEELHWARKLSTVKIAGILNIKYRMTLRKIVKRLGVSTRDKIMVYWGVLSHYIVKSTRSMRRC